MTTGKPIKIAGMGTYLPKAYSSAEIEQLHGIPLGWSDKYSGVSNRHHVTHESVASMGAKAAEDALAESEIGLADIDMLISAGGSYDYPLPNQASLIKRTIKGGEQFDFPAIDIDSTCLSFTSAFDFASRVLDGNSLRTILIVSSEVSSKGLNHANWETTTLFGDAAVAAVVTYDETSDSLFVKGKQKTYSEGVEYAMIEGGGNEKFFREHGYDSELHSFRMEGKKLLRLAKKKIPDYVNEFFEDLPMSIHDANVIIPHQTSKMGMGLFQNLFKFKDGLVMNSLSAYGNCMAASIPLTLAMGIRSGEINRGDTCFMIGTSAGFSIGGVLIKY